MRYYDFKSKIMNLCEERNEDFPSSKEVFSIFRRYKKTVSFIRNKRHAKLMSKTIMNFSEKQRLVYRNELAELGIELTPDQVGLYIYMLYIVCEEYIDDTK